MKRQQLLILLALVLVAAIIYAIQTTPEQQRVESGSRPSEGIVRSGDLTTAGNNDQTKESLRLELLDRADTEFEDVSRDIFHFYIPPPPPPPPAPVVKQPLPPPPPPVVKAPPPPPTLQQSVRFTFLGLLSIEEELTVFLAAEDELYVVKDGDSFGEKQQFLVEDISVDEIQISQKDRPGMIKVALTEKEKKPAHGVVSPAAQSGNAPLMRRPTPPVGRPQFRSFKKYEP